MIWVGLIQSGEGLNRKKLEVLSQAERNSASWQVCLFQLHILELAE